MHHDRSGKRYVTVDEEGEGYNMDDAQGIFMEEDDENYVRVNDGDLEELFEEADLQEALATYQEVRKAVRDQKTQ